MRTAINTFVILGCIGLFWACQNDSATQAAYEGPVVIEELKDSSIFLVCEDITQSADRSKHHEVYITIGPNRVKVGEIEGCRTINSSEYAALGIPEDALHALGDPANPESSLVYATRVRGDLITVRKGLSQPDSVPPYIYRSLATFSNNELSPVAEVNKADLVGIYTMGGANKSFLFLVGMDNRSLSAHLYEIQDTLPSPAAFHEVFKAVKPERLPGFRVNLEELTFQSDLLNGSFTREGDRYVIQTENYSGNGNQPLYLRPMEGK